MFVTFKFVYRYIISVNLVMAKCYLSILFIFFKQLLMSSTLLLI